MDTIRCTDTSAVWMYISDSGALQCGIVPFAGVTARLEPVFLEVAAVHGQMAPELIRPCESLGAVGPRTGVGLLSCVRTHVRLEVVGSRKLALANVALEGSDTGVLSAVTAKLIGS